MRFATLRAALEYIGTPSSYFPVSTPPARGDQVIVPTPTEERDINHMQGNGSYIYSSIFY